MFEGIKRLFNGAVDFFDFGQDAMPQPVAGSSDSMAETAFASNDPKQLFLDEVAEIEALITSYTPSSNLSLHEIEQKIQILDAKFGYRSMVRDINGEQSLDYNYIMNDLLLAYYHKIKEGPIVYAKHEKVNQLLNDEEIMEFIRQLPANTRNLSDEARVQIRLFEQILLKKGCNSAVLVGIGNNINFRVNIDGVDYFLKINNKQGRCSRKALIDIANTAETSSILTEVLGQRKHISEKSTDNPYDAITLVKPAVGDIFSYAKGLSAEQKAMQGGEILLQMLTIYQLFYQSDITMEDGKGSNFGIDKEGHVFVIDDKSIAYIEDIANQRQTPVRSIQFTAQDAALFSGYGVNSSKLAGEQLKQRQQKLMIHFLGLNMAMFTLGKTESDVENELILLQKQGKNIQFTDYIKECLAKIDKDEPHHLLAQTALDFLNEEKNFVQARQMIAELMPIAAASSSCNTTETNVAIPCFFRLDSSDKEQARTWYEDALYFAISCDDKDRDLTVNYIEKLASKYGFKEFKSFRAIANENKERIVHDIFNHSHSSMSLQVKVLKWYLAQNANPNSTASKGNTLLHKAAFAGNLQAVELLVDNGADVHLCNSNGCSVLEAAEFGKHHQVVQFIKSKMNDNQAIAASSTISSDVEAEANAMAAGPSSQEAQIAAPKQYRSSFFNEHNNTLNRLEEQTLAQLYGIGPT